MHSGELDPKDIKRVGQTCTKTTLGRSGSAGATPRDWRAGIDNLRTFITAIKMEINRRLQYKIRFRWPLSLLRSRVGRRICWCSKAFPLCHSWPCPVPSRCPNPCPLAALDAELPGVVHMGIGSNRIDPDPANFGQARCIVLRYTSNSDQKCTTSDQFLTPSLRLAPIRPNRHFYSDRTGAIAPERRVKFILLSSGVIRGFAPPDLSAVPSGNQIVNHIAG